jgi:hypothetical protein
MSDGVFSTPDFSVSKVDLEWLASPKEAII